MEAMKLPYDCRGMPAYETEVDGWTVGPVLSKLHMSDDRPSIPKGRRLS